MTTDQITDGAEYASSCGACVKVLGRTTVRTAFGPSRRVRVQFVSGRHRHEWPKSGVRLLALDALVRPWAEELQVRSGAPARTGLYELPSQLTFAAA